MVLFVVVFLAGATAAARAQEKERRNMNDRSVYSRKTVNVPRILTGIPRAMSQRYLSSSSSDYSGSERSLSFDEASGTLYVQQESDEEPPVAEETPALEGDCLDNSESSVWESEDVEEEFSV